MPTVSSTAGAYNDKRMHLTILPADHCFIAVETGRTLV